jgi:hypothetical protein
MTATSSRRFSVIYCQSSTLTPTLSSPRFEIPFLPSPTLFSFDSAPPINNLVFDPCRSTVPRVHRGSSGRLKTARLSGRLSPVAQYFKSGGTHMDDDPDSDDFLDEEDTVVFNARSKRPSRIQRVLRNVIQKAKICLYFRKLDNEYVEYNSRWENQQ